MERTWLITVCLLTDRHIHCPLLNHYSGIRFKIVKVYRWFNNIHLLVLIKFLTTKTEPQQHVSSPLWSRHYKITTLTGWLANWGNSQTSTLTSRSVPLLRLLLSLSALHSLHLVEADGRAPWFWFCWGFFLCYSKRICFQYNCELNFVNCLEEIVVKVELNLKMIYNINNIWKCL